MLNMTTVFMRLSIIAHSEFALGINQFLFHVCFMSDLLLAPQHFLRVCARDQPHFCFMSVSCQIYYWLSRSSTGTWCEQLTLSSGNNSSVVASSELLRGHGVNTIGQSLIIMALCLIIEICSQIQVSPFVTYLLHLIGLINSI